MIDLHEAVSAFEKAHDDHARIELDYNAKRAEIMARIADELNALEVEYRPYLDEAEKRKAEAETELRAAVLIANQSVKGRFVTASIVKPRVTWNTTALDRYAIAHPEISRFRKEGTPSVALRIGAQKP